MDISKTVLSPCKNCSDRWIDTNTLKRCHDSCEKYMAYKNQLERNRTICNNEYKLRAEKYERIKNWDKNKEQIRREKIKQQRYKTL